MLLRRDFRSAFGALIVIAASCASVTAAARSPRVPQAVPAPLADVSPDAKKAQSLLQAAKGKLERADGKGGHKEKAIASIDLALAEIAKGPSGTPLDSARSGATPLAANERLSAALKLLIGAKAALNKAGNHAKAVTHVDEAIGHVKAAIAAG